MELDRFLGVQKEPEPALWYLIEAEFGLELEIINSKVETWGSHICTTLGSYAV